MIVQITRELRIVLLNALREGYIDSNDFKDFFKLDTHFYSELIGNLTKEERTLLLRIGEKYIEQI